MSETVTFAPLSASGGASLFVVPFPYLDEDHVKLYVNGVEDTNKAFLAKGAIQASVAIGEGDIIVVKRETPRSALIETLPNSGSLSSDDVNHQSLQAVYVATEAADGLREGLALDITEVFWEGNPSGHDRTIKNVVDPSLAQDAATKGYIDTTLDAQIAAAQASAIAANLSAGNASVDEITAAAQAAAATVSAAAAAVSESSASASASAATTSGTNASDAATEAEQWANHPEDDDVAYTNPGQTPTAYSAKHWANKASADETSAAADEATAAAVAAASTPPLASIILGDEEGVVFNYMTHTVAINDFDTTPATRYEDETLIKFRNNALGKTMASVNSACLFDGRQYYSDGSHITAPSWWDPPIDEITGLRVGQHVLTGDRHYTRRPSTPGSGNNQSVSGVTAGTSSTYGASLVDSQNPTRVREDSSTGEHYIQSDCGESGVVPAAGEPLKVTVTLSTGGTWDLIEVEFYNDYDSLTYVAEIDMDDLSVNSSTFAGYRKFAIANTEWTTFEFFVTAPTGELDNTLSYARVYLDKVGGRSFTGATTDYIYMAYFDISRGWQRGTFHVSRASLGAFHHLFNMGNISGGLPAKYPGFTNTENTYMTWWGQIYLRNNYYHTTAISANPLIAGSNGNTNAGIQHLRRKKATGELEVFLDSTLSPFPDETWDTGITVTIDDEDNDGLGTKLSFVWTIDGNDHVLYVKVNDGTTQTASNTFTTAVNFATYVPNNNILGTDTNVNRPSGGKILRYMGAITRPLGSDEVDRYFNF